MIKTVFICTATALMILTVTGFITLAIEERKKNKCFHMTESFSNPVRYSADHGCQYKPFSSSVWQKVDLTQYEYKQ